MSPPTAAPTLESSESSLATPAQDKRQSYYERNKVNRQDYQRKYAAAQRSIGRRKISRIDLEQKRMELREEWMCLPGYSNVLPYVNGMKDPERTLIMAMDEHEVLQQCKTLQRAAREFGESASDPRWRLKYADDVRVLLNERLAQAKANLASPIDVPLAQHRRMHTHRRIIAGLHQQIELFSQGLEAVDRASIETGLILNGIRVRKRAFKQLYGF
ncbi:hypothetical protein FA95DRAFT_1608535 [Auriscalpium vulgare]|uniref:Uncharacterized protein n=1 Tax=Auriscalpium vulgare TaxID=40419 RepID=A0ACB8RJX0_9AGAM|nr:hypothetical protein FA95DRAFT_1608535 [Auriscalpium vulgare]